MIDHEDTIDLLDRICEDFDAVLPRYAGALTSERAYGWYERLSHAYDLVSSVLDELNKETP